MKKGRLAIGMAIAFGFVWAVGLCAQTLRSQAVAAFSKGELRVALDAGHGGIDGGVSGVKTGVKESEVNLEICMELKDCLEDAGFEVTLTRKTDAGLYGTTAKGFKKRDMQKRKQIVQDCDPALVLSVHQNRYPSQRVRGGQVFYRKGNEQGRALAAAVQEKLNTLYLAEGVKERIATPAEYFMLHLTDAPALLIECGFLSNEQDEALLRSSAFQRLLAEKITAGVVRFFEKQSG